jgi:tetratricopeptide (TPR) repeat protein
VAARARQSAVRADIVAALDEWASITPDRGRQAWLLAVAREADPDPVRDSLRQPEMWQNSAELTRLVQDPRVAEYSPHLATALGRVAREHDGDAVPLLTAAQAHFPQDFWLTFELGWALYDARRWAEALGYFRAALALRPDTSATHNGLGTALRNMGRLDEAIGHFQQAIRLDPKHVWARANLGDALRIKGRLDEAIGHLEQALRLNPRSAVAHNNLGLALYAQGRRDAAIDSYNQALGIDPSSPVIHLNLARELHDMGRLDEAMGHFEEALRLDPKNETAQAWLCTSYYATARAAIRAASGQGSANGQLGEPERVGKRREALDRLRAGLELKAKLRKGGKPAGGSLTAWQTDPALASVRDPAALAMLPEAEREPWRRLWADVAALLATDPLEQGRTHAARRDWAHAADCYARAFTRGPMEDGHFWFEYAALLLLSGDRPGYARACTHLVERCGQDGGPRSYHVARACTLAPDAVAETSLAGRLAEAELRASARQFWSLTEQGALAYRAGRFQQAVLLFQQSLLADSRPGRAVLNWLWLALANQRQGKTEEARRWLDKAQGWLDQYGDGMSARAEQEFGLHLHNWLEAHVLRREAEALIPSKGPRSGDTERPRDADATVSKRLKALFGY